MYLILPQQLLNDIETGGKAGSHMSLCLLFSTSAISPSPSTKKKTEMIICKEHKIVYWISSFTNIITHLL